MADVISAAAAAEAALDSFMAGRSWKTFAGQASNKEWKQFCALLNTYVDTHRS